MSAPVFRRRVDFEKGYNYLHEKGPSRRGQHGMGIRFLLIGPHGAAQFLMNTGWTPLGPVDEGRLHQEPIHIDRDGLRTQNFGRGEDHYGLTRAPSGFDLGYHWKTPLYPGQEESVRFGCGYHDGPKCYYDGSGLGGEQVLLDFISQGERAVWQHLVKRYRGCLESMVEYEQEMNRG